MTYTDEAMGRAIHAARRGLLPAVTQEQLGIEAGYASRGAGVSISRVESGRMRPSAEKLERIAAALGVAPQELARRAEELTGAAHDAAPAAGRRTARQRAAELHRSVTARQAEGELASSRLDASRAAARDEFLVPFVRNAALIAGKPQRRALAAGSDDPGSPAPGSDGDWLRLGRLQEEIAAALAAPAASAAAADAAGVLVAAAGTVAGTDTEPAVSYVRDALVRLLGNASTGTPIIELHGIARSNAIFAKFGLGTKANGGFGVAGGKLMQKAAIIVPLGIIAIAGTKLARRSIRRAAEFEGTVTEAETLHALGERGFDALVSMTGRSAAILDFIAVHGAHAQRKWHAALGDGAASWASMTARQQDRYGDLVAVLACQMAAEDIASVAHLLLTMQGDELTALIEATSGSLDHIDAAVRSLI